MKIDARLRDPGVVFIHDAPGNGNRGGCWQYRRQREDQRCYRNMTLWTALVPIICSDSRPGIRKYPSLR